MKESRSISENKLSVRKTIELLGLRFGKPKWQRREPLEELIVTIISQNTSDHNRDIAFSRLQSAFPKWENLLNEDVKAIEEAIRPAGLAVQKSSRIKKILEWIKATFGSLTLEPLREMPDEEVIGLLTSQKGIGIKTVAVLLAFAFDRDICPVDTHVHRISKRLGWINKNDSAERAFYLLKPLIPAGKAVSFHLNLLKFGRTICSARNPRCIECPLWDDCIWEG